MIEREKNPFFDMEVPDEGIDILEGLGEDDDDDDDHEDHEDHDRRKEENEDEGEEGNEQDKVDKDRENQDRYKKKDKGSKKKGKEKPGESSGGKGTPKGGGAGGPKGVGGASGGAGGAGGAAGGAGGAAAGAGGAAAGGAAAGGAAAGGAAAGAGAPVIAIGCAVILVLAIIGIVIYFLVAEGGETQENLDEVLCPKVGNLSCYNIKAKYDSCYHEAIMRVEAETDVPWQMIAAVDFKEWELGEQDKRGVTNYEALTIIAKQLQRANLKRYPKGHPKEGEVIEPYSYTISKQTDIYDRSQVAPEDKHQDLLYTAYKLMPYECLYTTEIFNNGESEAYRAAHCYDCAVSEDQMSSMLLNMWMIQNSNIPGPAGWVGCDADYEETGALVFYNYLMENCPNSEGGDIPPPPPQPHPDPDTGECASKPTAAEKAICYAMSVQGHNYLLGTPSRNWPDLNPASVPADQTFDCSGLTGWAWWWATDGGVNMAGQTNADWDGGAYPRVGSWEELAPGDLAYFDTGYGPAPSHVTMKIDDNQFVHAGEPVQVATFHNGYWDTVFMGGLKMQ